MINLDFDLTGDGTKQFWSHALVILINENHDESRHDNVNKNNNNIMMMMIILAVVMGNGNNEAYFDNLRYLPFLYISHCTGELSCWLEVPDQDKGRTSHTLKHMISLECRKTINYTYSSFC